MKVEQRIALLQTEQKISKQVQDAHQKVLHTEQVALKAESIVQGVATVLPQHRQVLDVLQQKIAITEEKAKFAEDITA